MSLHCNKLNENYGPTALTVGRSAKLIQAEACCFLFRGTADITLIVWCLFGGVARHSGCFR